MVAEVVWMLRFAGTVVDIVDAMVVVVLPPPFQKSLRMK